MLSVNNLLNFPLNILLHPVLLFFPLLISFIFILFSLFTRFRLLLIDVNSIINLFIITIIFVIFVIIDIIYELWDGNVIENIIVTNPASTDEHYESMMLLDAIAVLFIRLSVIGFIGDCRLVLCRICIL